MAEMVHAIRHDPYSLFGFALRESDWILADLLARRLGSGRSGQERLERELRANPSRAGRPSSLRELRRLARLTHALDLEEPGA